MRLAGTRRFAARTGCRSSGPSSLRKRWGSLATRGIDARDTRNSRQRRELQEDDFSSAADVPWFLSSASFSCFLSFLLLSEYQGRLKVGEPTGKTSRWCESSAPSIGRRERSRAFAHASFFPSITHQLFHPCLLPPAFFPPLYIPDSRFSACFFSFHSTAFSLFPILPHVYQTRAKRARSENIACAPSFVKESLSIKCCSAAGAERIGHRRLLARPRIGLVPESKRGSGAKVRREPTERILTHVPFLHC